ncbi:IS30 family transposase, partial [Peptostreptococcus faecalis]|uniref:IS30 family transposase n=1 Tax=Peptostreptococcus faecalis TaxID=2045015 RepID=UPI000C7B1AAC
GQAIYESNRLSCCKSLNLEKCRDFIDFVIDKYVNLKWSLDACIGYAIANSMFTETVCMKTLYNYVGKEIIAIKNYDLPFKLRRAENKKFSKEHKRKLGKSISERPSEIESRLEFGHWEIDTVLGGKSKDQNCVFSLVERKTRYYLPIKVASKDSKSIKEAFQSLVYSFKSNVSEVLKSITCDNGSEFSEMHTFEYLSDIYFAHPFSSYERGTNEKHNGLLRRFLPKGTSMNKVSK